MSTGTFYENFFCKKSLPPLVWILPEKTAKFPPINVVRVVATAFYLSKNTVRRETSLFFGKNTFLKQFWVVSQFVWIFGKQKFGSILRIAFYVSQKTTGRRKFDFESNFWLYFCNSEQKKGSDCCIKRYGKVVKTAI